MGWFESSCKNPSSDPERCRSLYYEANHKGTDFCGYCGTPMRWTCPDGHVVPLWAVFCPYCGKARP